jgi:hypothetical protein
MDADGVAALVMLIVLAVGIIGGPLFPKRRK